MCLLQVLPYRQEPLYWMARIYRVEYGDYERCYSYASSARAQGPRAPKRALFANQPIYNYFVLKEACMCGYHTGELGRTLVTRSLVD